MDPEVRTVLEDAYELLKDPDHFVINTEVAGPPTNPEVDGLDNWDRYSLVVDCNSPNAARWCAIGAIAKVMDCPYFTATGPVGWEAVALLSEKAAEVFPDFISNLPRLLPPTWGPDLRNPNQAFYIVQVNNQLGHDAVIQVFEKVLAEDGGIPV